MEVISLNVLRRERYLVGPIETNNDSAYEKVKFSETPKQLRTVCDTSGTDSGLTNETLGSLVTGIVVAVVNPHESYNPERSGPILALIRTSTTSMHPHE